MLGALIFLPRGNGTTVVSDLGCREVAEPNCGQWEEEYTLLTLEGNQDEAGEWPTTKDFLLGFDTVWD